MDNSILAPAAVLVVWSLIMLLWLAGTRLPAMSKAGIDLSKAVGGRGADIDPNVPPSVAWKSHNYSHLMEQPTILRYGDDLGDFRRSDVIVDSAGVVLYSN